MTGLVLVQGLIRVFQHKSTMGARQCVQSAAGSHGNCADRGHCGCAAPCLFVLPGLRRPMQDLLDALPQRLYRRQSGGGGWARPPTLLFRHYLLGRPLLVRASRFWAVPPPRPPPPGACSPGPGSMH